MPVFSACAVDHGSIACVEQVRKLNIDPAVCKKVV